LNRKRPIPKEKGRDNNDLKWRAKRTLSKNEEGVLSTLGVVGG